jgi:hypothetical protein
MLVYAGEAHAKILDALDAEITDEQWKAIEASAEPIKRSAPTAALGAHFPGWHGVTELGW